MDFQHRIAYLTSLQDFCKNHSEIPEEFVAAACQNPWFSPYYVQTAWQAICKMMAETDWTTFLEKYPRLDSRRKVGIICAGNLPMVGFHDVWMGILSGHSLEVKCSHQDKILLPWWISAWQKWSGLDLDLVFVSQISAVDFLIATGSDQTRKQIGASFVGVKQLLRGHRTSAALLREQMSEAEWQALVQDIYLYNGMGCRSITQVFVQKEEQITILSQKLADYPSEYLTETYLQKVKQEKVQKDMLKIPYLLAGKVLLDTAPARLFAPMGILNVWQMTEKESLHFQALNESAFQCFVKGEYTSTQMPLGDSFADNIDTLAWLLSDN